MLTWLEAEVESPYGPVATLHWAVPEGDEHQQAEDGEGPERHADLRSAEDQLGAVLWNSNRAALRYLTTSNVFPNTSSTSDTTDRPPLAGQRVVELGAGVGCLGISLAMAGARVCITDLQELLPLMAHNAKRNRRRITQRSMGVGSCEAFAWRWGPSVSLNIKKLMKQQKCDPLVASAARDDLLQAVLSGLRESSAPWRTVQAFMQAETVDCLILCDALYGNPRDWPPLLYTLSEVLAASAREGKQCRIVNFCEQRVKDVEAAFLELLAAENRLPPLTAPTTPAGHHSVLRDILGACSGSDPKETEAAENHTKAALDVSELPSRLLSRVNRELRGPHKWLYRTEHLNDVVSDLHMSIKATVIEWVLPPAVDPARVEEEGSPGPTRKKLRREVAGRG